ncbi:Ferritin-like domain-containing protein [Catalinimonas alkaloidigena]|uniref:Ferritin-like domain-containing protein n=1 Tax=Catalinimonas alkaloidigena TaxID=1075417 RepID=A0A1G9EH14_9BACT|nr:ferritin-like domain-containing protein [Catalinimonas alkaloidigena]SDK75363.1 Ferritin-like domain-containing protein [Catalinimonas alkaloidigena]
MNIFHIIDQFQLDIDPKKATSRRDAFRMFGDLGAKSLLAAVPFGLAALASSPARAQSMANPVEVLNFALLLEYLENEYYLMGLDAGVIPAGSDAEMVFAQISKHEAAHVEFLKTAISGAGGTPIDKPTFDFTVSGTFDPFGSYDQFLALSQAFEDTGVRAYKGQAGNLLGASDVLKAALQIHSVEARHASEVRRIRGLMGWITQDQRGTGMPAETQAVYNGEDNVMQGGVDAVSITSVGADAVTEAYDEPLTKDEVTTIASLFLKA